MYEELDDTELLALSRTRPQAFGPFYERHAEPLLRYFARRTFDPDTAAELTAETFAQAFASRAKYRSLAGAADDGPVRWLFGIGRHQFGRYLRRGAVEDRARRKLGLPERTLSTEDYERIEELVDADEVRRTVSEAFGLLSKDQREAVTLRVLEGRTYQEVAAALRCTEQAARARVSRGLHRLGQLLEITASNERSDPTTTPIEVTT